MFCAVIFCNVQYIYIMLLLLLLLLCVCSLVTYDEKMSLTDPEALFQQKIPQVYLKLQESVQSAVVAMRTNDKPPVMRSEEFR